MKLNKELVKGSLEILILSVVKDTPRYGYDIVRQIKARSQDVFSLGEGTLYPLLHKLENAGWLASYWQEIEGRRRKYYTITSQGKKFLAAKSVEWKTFSQAINQLL